MVVAEHDCRSEFSLIGAHKDSLRLGLTVLTAHSQREMPGLWQDGRLQQSKRIAGLGPGGRSSLALNVPAGDSLQDILWWSKNTTVASK